MINKYICSLFLVLPFALFSQSKVKEQERKFDSIYYDAATNIAITDIDRAFVIADSLYQHSKLDVQKLRSLMLSSMFYQNIGASDKTIEYALKAEEIAIKTKDYNWQARILGFLSTEFHNIGIINEREEFIKRMGEVVPKIKDDLQRSLMFPMYYQEQAIFYLENKNDMQGWKYIRLAKEYLDVLDDSPTKFMLLGLNERVHGSFFLKLNQEPDSALAHYENSLLFYEKAENLGNYAKDFLYSGMGQAYLMKGQDSLGMAYMEKAEKISEELENVPLTLEIYEYLYNYYKEKGNTQKYVHYLEKYQELHRLVQNQKIKPVEVLLSNLKKQNQDLNYSRTSLLMASILLVIIIILGYLWYRKKRKKDYQRFQEIIAELKKNGFVSANTVITTDESYPEIIFKKDKPHISEEAEQKIIEGLKAFENSDHFRNANYALADLASEIGVNTKYLSRVLNNNYGKDFNTYINELRINYIIDKLKTQSDYKLYKLSFLAEESGFSSHSKFSAVFKTVTGLTPTKFIHYLEKDMEFAD